MWGVRGVGTGGAGVGAEGRAGGLQPGYLEMMFSDRQNQQISEVLSLVGT